jgi:uncharacterized protein (DUF3820 family)
MNNSHTCRIPHEAKTLFIYSCRNESCGETYKCPSCRMTIVQLLLNVIVVMCPIGKSFVDVSHFNMVLGRLKGRKVRSLPLCYLVWMKANWDRQPFFWLRVCGQTNDYVSPCRCKRPSCCADHAMRRHTTGFFQPPRRQIACIWFPSVMAENPN